ARRSDCRSFSVQPRPSHSRSRSIAASKSGRLRARSVSSRRRMKVPPCRLANSQLNKAARTLPTCSSPVGLGAKRTTGAGEVMGGDLWRAGADGQAGSAGSDVRGQPLEKPEAGANASKRIRRIVLLDKEMLYAHRERRSNDPLDRQNTCAHFGY